MLIEYAIASFFASAAFGIIYQAPRNTIIKCGLVGMIGWVIYISLVWREVDSVPATLIASFVIAMVSQMLARIYKTPMIIFSVPGIIPLVPGSLAYDAMRNFVQNDYSVAISIAAKAFMISGAIAFGLVFSEVLNQIIKKIRQTKVQLR
ncbi:threonine/serine exporter family protein [Halobacillus sp. Nhm2S1]|uniref:threonine/serine exporter family protein n=1 Tax=Halobacillus sp. Nhm2S1 TaxID=2866716 RepID=UPI001C73D4C1|nr:threonine/serine exporter family protein [Halobacillus sp. Nhm2S1]MBX0359540.1 threonine/serine exporter family protein [Halobacillus sp. Nhm2S1]